MATDILNYFPMATPRESQVKILGAIGDRLAGGKFDNIVLSAPTGTGKSPIGLCASLWATEHLPLLQDVHQGAYYLVTQKLLQDQLQNDAQKARPRACASVKSSESYKCHTYANCGVGRRVLKGHSACGNCPYITARSAFEEAAVGITNYAYLLSCLLYTDKLGPRQLLVADECHTVEDQVIRFSDAQVSYEHVKKWAPLLYWPKLSGMDAYRRWLKAEYVPAISETLANMVALEEGNPDPDSEITELDKHMCKINRALDLTEDLNARKNWVFWEEGDDPEQKSFILRPIFGKDHMGVLDGAAGQRIFMSATPGPKDLFCASLGLDPHRTAYINIGSEFPESHREVHFKPIGSMGSSSKAETLPRLLRTIQKITTLSPERGLIHCASYELGEKIHWALIECGQGHRVVFPKKADDREEAFKKHALTEGSVIISPSMTEGFDFAGELARWQIIAKIAWPYLGDKQVEARRAVDPDWYAMKAAIATIQACGRICRSKEDWGVTYILDSDLGWLMEKNAHLFPKWFTQAFAT